MRETNFIDQNKKKWKDFERILDGQYKDPEKLKDLFIQVTDDLSYSRTFYSNRSVRVYLNNLAQRVFFSIYKSKKSPFRRILNFWVDDLPQLIYESRQAFRLSLAVFVVSMLIGVLSSMMDPEFANVILSDAYVDMTLENIDSGDPMAVYKDRGAFNMSLGITLNNLSVALFTFILGALFGVGTLLLLISNAIMVGTFQYFFIERGLFVESFLTIWIHGTLEISAIVIAGAAGLTMGQGLVFPGTYSRLQAFQRSARRGLKILIGIAPVIILAGFIEGYLTRFTETSNFVRALFIILCFAFVMVYFVWYPVRKARMGFKSPLKDLDIPPDKQHLLRVDTIKSSGEIFGDVFAIFRNHYNKIFLLAFVTSVCYCFFVFLSAQGNPDDVFYYPAVLFGTIGEMDQFFVNANAPLLPLGNVIVFSFLTLFAQHYVIKSIKPQAQLNRQMSLSLLGKFLIGVISMQLVLWTNSWYTPLLVVFIFPLPILYNFITHVENKGIGFSMKRMLFLIRQNYGRVLGLFILLLLLCLFFFLIVDSSMVGFFFTYISWVIYLDQMTMNQLGIVVLTFVSIYVLHLLYMLVITGISILYFTLREIKEADHLREKILHMGSGKKIQGLERE